MRNAFQFSVAAAAVALTAIASALPASATCTRLAFSVNDYGKDGPSKDAKQLLDKYVSKWAKDHNISKYVTGKKDVSCELFLNFVLFDEHTCKASASVCWDGPAVPGMPGAKPETAATTTTEPGKAKSSATTTGSIEKPAPKPAAEKTEAVVKKEDPSAAKPEAEAKKAAVTTDEKAAAAKKDPGAAGSASGAPQKPVVRSAVRVKPKNLTGGDAAKAAEAAKPKAPLPEKPESAPVQ